MTRIKIAAPRSAVVAKWIACAWLVVSMLPMTQAIGQTANGAKMLVQANQIDTKIPEAQQAIIDVRAKNAYDAGHIPGAVWIDANAWRDQSLKPDALQDTKYWRDTLGSLGIQNQTRVIVYGDQTQNTARIWWLLSYLGCADVRILDGGWKAWEASGGPKETKSTVRAAAHFDVKFQSERLATLTEIQKEAVDAQTCQILDNRTKEEYEGTVNRGGRAGHIPGAQNLDWTALVDENGKFLPEATLRQKLAAAGIDLSKPVATHCQSGARSSVGAFVYEMLTGKPAKNYYRGWSEWGTNESVPITK